MKSYFADHNIIVIKAQVFSSYFMSIGVFTWFYCLVYCISINRWLVQSLHTVHVNFSMTPLLTNWRLCSIIILHNTVCFTHWIVFNCLVHASSLESVFSAVALSFLSLVETRSCSYEAEIIDRTYANSAEDGFFFSFIKTLIMLFVLKWGKSSSAIKVIEIYQVP